MFKRLYRKKLNTGDKTALAYHVGKSEEWISRLTRYGGDPCPTEKYFRWYCGMSHVNADAADAMHEELNAKVAEVRHEREDGGPEWSPRMEAVSLLQQATRTISALLETPTQADDLPALLDLKLLVEKSIDRCGAQQKKARAR